MKKLTLVLGAIVLGFMLTSCENKKDAVIAAFNAFFDQEVTALNAVDNADAFLEYIDASDARFEEFYAKLDKDFPIDENDNLAGMKQEDSDAAMQVYNDRFDAYWAARDTKAEELYEPYIAKLEDVVNGLADDIINQVEPADDIVDQLLAAYDNIDKYSQLSSTEQEDRFNDVDELVRVIFGIDEEEE